MSKRKDSNTTTRRHWYFCSYIESNPKEIVIIKKEERGGKAEIETIREGHSQAT